MYVTTLQKPKIFQTTVQHSAAGEFAEELNKLPASWLKILPAHLVTDTIKNRKPSKVKRQGGRGKEEENMDDPARMLSAPKVVSYAVISKMRCVGDHYDPADYFCKLSVFSLSHNHIASYA